MVMRFGKVMRSYSGMTHNPIRMIVFFKVLILIINIYPPI